MSLAERIHATLRGAEHGPAPLTVSIGVAGFDSTMGAWPELLAKADEAMYEAKRAGKNRTAGYDRSALPAR